MPDSLAQPIQVGALTVLFHVDPDQSGGNVTVFECLAPAKARMPAPHSHDDFDETAFGLEGGVIHGFDNKDDVDARFLAVISPGMLGPSYFQEVAEVLAGDGPPDIEKIGEVMRRHGLTPAPPP